AKTTRPEGGFFISLTLPEGISTTDVRTAAAKRGLNLADGLAFFPDGGGERFLRLPFCALTPEQIDGGVARLAASVKAISCPRTRLCWRFRVPGTTFQVGSGVRLGPSSQEGP